MDKCCVLHTVAEFLLFCHELLAQKKVSRTNLVVNSSRFAYFLEMTSAFLSVHAIEENAKLSCSRSLSFILNLEFRSPCQEPCWQWKLKSYGSTIQFTAISGLGGILQTGYSTSLCYLILFSLMEKSKALASILKHSDAKYFQVFYLAG